MLGAQEQSVEPSLVVTHFKRSPLQAHKVYVEDNAIAPSTSMVH